MWGNAPKSGQGRQDVTRITCYNNDAEEELKRIEAFRKAQAEIEKTMSKRYRNNNLKHSFLPGITRRLAVNF